MGRKGTEEVCLGGVEPRREIGSLFTFPCEAYICFYASLRVAQCWATDGLVRRSQREERQEAVVVNSK